MTLEIAQRLTEMRKARELSQEDLAHQLGVSRQAVSKWERAESTPDMDNLVALAKIYGVTLDQLVHGDEAEKAEEACEANKEPEPIDPENPLPHGSYFEAKAQAEEKRRQRKRNSFPYPVFITAVYLVTGFLWNWWHPGWIMFLTVPLYYLPQSQRGYIRLLGNPVMITIIYLLLGTMCNLWHPGWLIFLLIPLLNSWH